MNLLLINPFITVSELTVDLAEPLGLVYLATYVKEKFGDQITISVLDLYEMGADKPKRLANGYYMLGIDDKQLIRNKIEEFSPDLIGVTCNFTAYAPDALRTAAIAHSCTPDVPMVMGGAHATMDPETIMRENPFIDYIVREEGEATLEEMIRALQGEMPISSVDGLVYRTVDGQIKHSPDRKFIKNLDDIPIPDRSYIRMDRYSTFPRLSTWYTRKKPIASIITSRGCPYDCVFCSTKVMWRRRWRGSSVERIIEEIEYLEREYAVKEVTIFDDQFFTKKDRVLDFCNYFANREKKIAFSYDAGTSPWLVDEHMLTMLKKAGFYSIRFPIETGNEKTLVYVNKPVKLQQSLDLIQAANKLGFWTSGNFILGFPYEERKQMEDTVRYAYNSGLDFASFIAARPHKGSEMYETFKKEGLLDKGIAHTSLYDVSDYDTTKLTAKEITEIIQKASSGWYFHKLKFFLNPYNFVNFFLPKLQSWEDFTYMFRIFFVLVKARIIPLLRKKIIGTSSLIKARSTE